MPWFLYVNNLPSLWLNGYDDCIPHERHVASALKTARGGS
jgi:hypothetical protein